MTPDSGAVGIFLDANAGQIGQTGTLTAKVTSNTITIAAGTAHGIVAFTGNGAPTLNATITSNTITSTTGGSMSVESAKVSTDTSTACMEISGNNIPNVSGPEITISQRFSTTFRVRNFTGSTAAEIAAFLAAQNNLNGGTVLSEGTYSNTSPPNSQCPQPTLPS
jgi:hypothetical protein